jgi:hypothetical protein
MLRALLVLCAAFSVLAPAQLLHYALVQHVVCADHGELVHAAVSHEAHAAAAEAAPPEAEPKQGQGPALHADAFAHDHEHCAFAATPREGLTLPPSHAVVTIDAAACSTLLAALRTDAGISEALFRLAPKTSPPA